MASQHRRQSSYEDVFDLPGQSQMPAQPHQHHQTSFENGIDFSAEEPLTVDQRSHAHRRFEKAIEYFGNHVSSSAKFKPHLLIRYTYEFARSELSKDMILRFFFASIKIDIDSTEDIELNDSLLHELKDFADLLLNHFFAPLRSTGTITPQPSPASLSALQRVQGQHEFIGTPDRIAGLRSLCLLRDHHKCVVSQSFDLKEAISRLSNDPDARDDEGMQLRGQSLYALEVAHIIPHSLMQSDTSSGLSEAKKTVIQILNMFDYNVSHIINGTDIDRPLNAMSLNSTAHLLFKSFDIFLEPVDGQEHTYYVKSLKPAVSMAFGLPVTRKLFLSDDRSIEPPSPRLLALHRAFAHILFLSGAGEYINKILDDFDKTGVRADGTTELGRMVSWRMSGGLGGITV
ncbi:hypothetical protein H112_05858 [Trichophyton rubrum D6]|uniref:HNH nuclease domain-containing protein n=4 Tax=Trichophyton TaxID=5550 RepID=A0A178EQN1_TRIRU|nr:uncharacterized protein TERG_03564 [Trichophyton rubrum CBS 118892]EZF16020.1 hypothetical protein H100_05873 [Trichophyton rubrum MR850]EZF40149.1 hypothetical protein H102_05842 [Trichophyton rubrum CBS 100081]EZF50782.1 hypothetical protein H103_05869 [Trichophyton rubrum CBS 288.86]EZF61378.1 hypothetical protein H104_05855 [Trichophyton rubrum CBS 289.86]EZF72040.1 hypothetical protein H105_05883 [Trichophyton soudanense CBS 452.61]EZF82694.1 hypothetical protein H110_05864 [Trichophy